MWIPLLAVRTTLCQSLEDFFYQCYLLLSLLLVCLLNFFPFSYCLLIQRKNKLLVHLSPHEQRPSISKCDIGTKLNKVVGSVNSVVNVGIFQSTPMTWDIAVMKQKFIGTHFIAATAFLWP